MQEMRQSFLQEMQMKTVAITTRNLHQLATMCHDRAEEYRAPYLADSEQDGQTSFVTSRTYPIYAMLQEMWLMFNKFADNLEEESEPLKKVEEGPKFDHYCNAPGCRVEIFDPKEEFCQHHEGNRTMGVE